MHVSDSSKIMKKVYKQINETDHVVKLVERPEVLLRPDVCSLKNAIDASIDDKLFCLAHIGQKKHKDARQLCQSLNATLPLPTSITEHYHFIEIFKRLGINEKMNDFSTKVVLDARRLDKGRVSLFSALILKDDPVINFGHF